MLRSHRGRIRVWCSWIVRLGELIATHKDLARKLATLEKRYNAQFKVVFEAIRQLMTPPEPPKRKIGFLVKEKAASYGRG